MKSFFGKEKLLLFGLFAVALFLRLYNLSSIPFGFHMDEVANTYIGRFILENGKDLYGNSWPILYFDKFGDYPPVLPMYLSGFATYIFGVNEFAARFPAALIGSLAVFPLFFLLKRFISSTAAFIGVVVLALLPWHIVLSRSSSEGVIGFSVFLLGLCLLFKGMYEKRQKIIFYSIVIFLLTYLLYPTFRLVIPLTLLPLPFLFGSDKKIQKTLLVVLAIVIVATGVVASTQWGKGRFNQTSLFSNSTDQGEISNDLKKLSNDEGVDAALLARIFHNKAIGYSQRLMEQYLFYFSPHFLYFDQAKPERYDVPHVGLVYFTFLILLPFLFYAKPLDRNKKVYLYSFYLLFVSVLPSTITVDDFPNIHRSLAMILPIVLLVVLGVINIIDITKGRMYKIFAVCIGFVFLLELLYSGHQYFAHAGSQDTFNRNDGNTNLAYFLIQNRNKYEEIVVPYADWMPIYYLFYSNDFSSKYINLVPKGVGGFEIGKIENLSFTEKKCPSDAIDDLSSKSLVVDLGDCKLIPRYDEIGVIQRRDGTIAFRLLTPKKK